MHFVHYGCKVNQYETNAMEQKFIQAGYKIVKFNEKADIYVINTCTVTNMSDKKSRQMIRKAKQLNKDAIVVAVGCYVQTAKEKLENIEELDLILGNNEKKDIVKYVEEHKNGTKQIKYNDVLHQEEYDEYGFVTHIEQTRAIVKIQDGCDRFCSYCAIPYARGRVRSRKKENIIEEITKLALDGIKEVVITGIHIASYGKDLKEDITLINVLEKINEIDGIKRIRLGSLEPTIITKDFLQRLSKLDKICHHFHLSLQSGCNETLQRMNRKYTTEEFKNVVEMLRETYEDVMLTTDIIVGFPGETEEEFEKTYNFLSDINFYKMHVFKYSKRNGTKAALMPNQVSPILQEQRSKKLIELSKENQDKYNSEYIGKEVTVLFEEENGEYIKGHTANYLVVNIKGNIAKLHNEIVKVKITSILGEELIGTM